jgi:hypothetical protein
MAGICSGGIVQLVVNEYMQNDQASNIAGIFVGSLVGHLVGTQLVQDDSTDERHQDMAACGWAPSVR